MARDLSAQFRDILQNMDSIVEDIALHAADALEQIVEHLAGEAESFHPYQDQTGELTASIRGYLVEVTKDRITGVLTAEMAYAAFVELCRNGEYAFILPTVEENEDVIMELLEQGLTD